MPERSDVLFFVEDPGAANFLQGLPEALRSQGSRVVLAAQGPAEAWLSERRLAFRPLPAGMRPEDVIAEAAPSWVAVGTAENPDNFGLDLVDAARKAGIPTVGLVDAFCNADHRFRGNSISPLAHAPDWILVPDEPTRGAFAGLGFPRERIEVCGHPAYDRALLEARTFASSWSPARRATLFPGSRPGVPVIAFLAEISSGPNPGQYRLSPDYTLRGDGASTGRTEIVLEELLAAVDELDPRPHVVLRLHPKNTVEEFAAYASRIDQISAGGAPHPCVLGADLVVGMTTVLMLEAAVMGKPTLSIVPRESEKEWLVSIADGATPCATDRASIRRHLRALLAARAPAREFLPANLGGFEAAVARFFREHA